MRTAHALGPLLLLRGLLADRRRPDLASLGSETDPERFVWRVLPHAARSFAASIVVLRGEQALAAAVAYLYCRMLDTYEDLIDDPAESVVALGRFASRFDSDRLEPPDPIATERARDSSDQLYLLLISRCELVDRVYAGLTPLVREQIRELVRAMAAGMAQSKEAFARQGGVLIDEEQLAQYCRSVIGHPAVFVVNLISPREVVEPAREDAFLVSEMIQLANVSRDIERDLDRGLGYHPALKPYLGPQNGVDRGPVVRDVREAYLAMALDRAPAYRRLFDGLDFGEAASTRTAAVLMLLFTDLHYRGCAARTGHRPWHGPRGRLQVVAESIPALLSTRWARHVIERVEGDFARAAQGLAVDAGPAPQGVR